MFGGWQLEPGGHIGRGLAHSTYCILNIFLAVFFPKINRVREAQKVCNNFQLRVELQIVIYFRVFGER